MATDTPRPENPALLAAIIANPDEDTPRLIYADWLQEHDDPHRAEFIRLNCDHLRKWKMNVADTADPGYVRMSELEQAYGEMWLGQMPKLPGIRWWCFWRGFPAIQVESWNALKRSAGRIWEVAPVERVDINSLSQPGARALVNSSYLERVRVLGLDWGVKVPALRTLLTAPKLVNLRNLVAFSCGFGDDGATAIANCPHLTSLEVAILSSNSITDRGALALARSPYLTRLERNLDLSRNPIGDEARKVLKNRYPGCC